MMIKVWDHHRNAFSWNRPASVCPERVLNQSNSEEVTHFCVTHTFFQYRTTHESEWKPGSRHQPKITWATIRDCSKARVWNAAPFIFIISLAKRSWGTGGFCGRSDVWSVRGRPEQTAAVLSKHPEALQSKHPAVYVSKRKRTGEIWWANTLCEYKSWPRERFMQLPVTTITVGNISITYNYIFL